MEIFFFLGVVLWGVFRKWIILFSWFFLCVCKMVLIGGFFVSIFVYCFGF